MFLRAANVTTSIKSVVNGIIAVGAGNYTGGARKRFLDNRHECPELLDKLEE